MPGFRVGGVSPSNARPRPHLTPERPFSWQAITTWNASTGAGPPVEASVFDGLRYWALGAGRADRQHDPTMRLVDDIGRRQIEGEDRGDQPGIAARHLQRSACPTVGRAQQEEGDPERQETGWTARFSARLATHISR